MKKIVLVIGLLLVSVNLYANQEIKECYSSVECVKIKFVEGPKAKVDSKFILKFESESTPIVKIENLQVILWMLMGNGHGHGSAPTQISAIGENEYLIENVWFVMKGKWDIKINFKSDGVNQELKIPVEILN